LLLPRVPLSYSLRPASLSLGTLLLAMENMLFNLKFVAKQFGKSSQKCEKEEKAEKMRCKKAMEKGNIDGAKIYAQNAIRKKNEAINYLRLQSRIEAVASRVDTAVKMRQVTKAMVGVVKGMEKVLETMDPEKISRAMDAFEKQFETLDVTSEYMEGAIGQSTAMTTPDDQVQALMGEIRDQYNLDVGEQLGSATPAAGVAAKQGTASTEDDLAARFARLKGGDA